MKTIVKYEKIINQALKSALNYDTPDEQIYEFIRFFGEHIHSDRIYIFEDNIADHTTINTYEWCASGITPQKDNLQNINMDDILWWYDAFAKEEPIIVPDVSALKTIYPESYSILNDQNINSLVVCPFHHKNGISGFFGVDNPPSDDYESISIFLDMIATLLISLLNLRNSFIRSSDAAKISSYSSLAEIYLSMHLINMQTGKYQIIKTAPSIECSIDRSADEYFPTQIKAIMSNLCSDRHLKSTLEFTDISTLESRMRGENTIAHEFLGNVSGWCRERFIKADYDKNGSLWHVLYCVEVIDAEKQRENKLLHLSETDLMTGIYNRASGEHRISHLIKTKTCGLMCLLDCDKFKNINDTYGHIIGDKVIIAVASILHEASGKDDIVMRLGGDEFAIYIPGLSDRDKASAFFNDLFERFKKINIPTLKGHPVYVSLGASFYNGDPGATFDKLYHEADIAMYESKKVKGYHSTIYDRI